MFENKKGQSTLEYIILIAAVIACVFVFMGPMGIFRSRLNESYEAATNSMTQAADLTKTMRVY